jgi:hypothetical protein
VPDIRLTKKIAAGNVLCFAGLLAQPFSALAAPAVRLIVSNNPCIAEPCPGPVVVPTVVAAGTSFLIFVAALDDANSTAPTFTGTVNFTSTDSLASLPSNFTFTPANEGSTRGGFTTILRTPGDQTITVTDASGQLLPGSFVMTVTGSASAESVPAISGWMKVLLAVTLALSGTLLSRFRA